jgi:hypothetical protein
MFSDSASQPPACFDDMSQLEDVQSLLSSRACHVQCRFVPIRLSFFDHSRAGVYDVQADSYCALPFWRTYHACSCAEYLNRKYCSFLFHELNAPRSNGFSTESFRSVAFRFIHYLTDSCHDANFPQLSGAVLLSLNTASQLSIGGSEFRSQKNEIRKLLSALDASLLSLRERLRGPFSQAMLKRKGYSPLSQSRQVIRGQLEALLTHYETAMEHLLEDAKRRRYCPRRLPSEWEIKIRRLPWILLPPGGRTWEAVVQAINAVRRVPLSSFECDRLHAIYSLCPSELWIGRYGLSGYVVFTFPGTERVVCEHPSYGNAVYILHSDWMSYVRWTKRELIEKPQVATRVIHNSSLWLDAVSRTVFDGAKRKSKISQKSVNVRHQGKHRHVSIPHADNECWYGQ